MLKSALARQHAPNLSKRDSYGSGCVQPGPTSISAPRSNIWGGLTEEETSAVAAWLYDQSDLNLTTNGAANAWDNTVFLVELMQPNKTDALNYIDGSGAAPVRYAHVLLQKGSTPEPVLSDILVGPLPVQAGTTTWQPLEYTHTRKTGATVQNLEADFAALDTWILSISGTITDITIDLWGGYANGSEGDTLDVFGVDPRYQDEQDGKLKVTYWGSFFGRPTADYDTLTLLPLGLYIKADVTGRDPLQWKFEGWFYNGIFYPTTEDFRAAYEAPGFVKLSANVDGAWTSTDQQGSSPPLDTAAPPAMAAPGGSRYSVDTESKYVEWMDFSFYLGFTRDRGMQLYDIRYKGERLLYELGLQEALAHYAGADPYQSGTAYLDSYYGFGRFAFQLVPGYDCPSYASYLNTSYYANEGTATHLNSICLFEFDANYPMARHSAPWYVSNTKNVFFTVRSVNTIGNYDYMFNYEFYLDGSIRVEVRASGYIQSAYFANNQDYGYQIYDSLSGSMHDHVLNFKADFDILGTDNMMELTSSIPTTETYPWSDKPRNTMKLSRRFITNENEGGLTYDANSATQYRIINTAQPNKYGEYRGYRIQPESTVHLTVLDSTNLGNAANWAKYDLAVTKQKDTEQCSAHPYNNQDVHNPPVDFDKFLDGENLEQEDLVVWFNLGMHHVPHTGDLPNTVFTSAHSSVRFTPVNYFERDESRKTVNMALLKLDLGVVNQIDLFGQKQTAAQCAVVLGEGEEEALRNGYSFEIFEAKYP